MFGGRWIIFGVTVFVAEECRGTATPPASSQEAVLCAARLPHAVLLVGSAPVLAVPGWMPSCAAFRVQRGREELQQGMARLREESIAVPQCQG